MTSRLSNPHPVMHDPLHVVYRGQHTERCRVCAMAGTGESRLPDYVFSGSTRSRRLRVPSFLRRNPIIYRRPPRRSSLVASTDGVLNAARILAAAEVHTPSEAASVVLSGESLSRVDADDLALFRALQYLDVGDNNLRLQWLAALPSLNELHLHCNGIAHIVLDDASYPSLRILGLAYNGLTPASIGELARIPCLEELDLTCNDITRVPQDMSAFRTLKKLSLRRNLLRDDAVWHALGQIPSLEVRLLRCYLLLVAAWTNLPCRRCWISARML